MKQKRLPDALGLRLTRQALRVLKERGIFAHSPVSLEHQHLAKRYVVRGLESGGAAGELGRYVTFTQEDGQPIEWLHPVEAIGGNGLHAVVVAPVLVRIGQSWHGSADVLFARRGGSRDTEAVSPSGARDNRGGSLRRLCPLPLCQAAEKGRGAGVLRE